MKFRYLWLLLVFLLLFACEDKATDPDESLNPPSNLTIEQLGFESIKLTWQDNSTNEIGFQIDRKIGEGDWEESYHVLSENITTFTDHDLLIIATYSYRIRAINLDEESEFVEAEIVFSYIDISYFSYPIVGPPLSVPCQGYTSLHLGLKDASGDPVDKEYEVWFKLLGMPEGCNINNELFNTADSISVHSVEGEIVVSLGGGQHPGVMAIKAYTYNSSGEEVTFIKSNIPVLAGAPEVMDISIYENGIVENLGDGTWQIELAVNIEDIHGNSSFPGTAVYFSLPDNPEGVVLPAPGAYIGNFSTAGDSIPGHAFTTLIYDGAYTNDEIQIKLEIGDFEDTEAVILPLQGGFLDVQAVPFHFEWTEETDPEYKDIELRTMLRDGQNNQINGQVLEFSTTHGTPLEPSPPDTGDPWSGITGVGTLPPYEGENGILYKYIRVYKDELPAPNPDPEPVQVFIHVNLLGVDISTEVIVTLTRMFD